MQRRMGRLKPRRLDWRSGTWTLTVETLDLATTPLVNNEGFRVVVRWQQPPVAQVTFELDVEIYYHPV